MKTKNDKKNTDRDNIPERKGKNYMIPSSRAHAHTGYKCLSNPIPKRSAAEEFAVLLK